MRFIFSLLGILSVETLVASSVWIGTITTDFINLNGSVDYSVDTDTDVMTLSNHQGDWATSYGPSQTFTLYALNDLTNSASNSFSPTISTFDMTDAHFQSNNTDGLGSTASDGWFWASAGSDSFFHLIIGGQNSSPALPVEDYTGVASGTGSKILDWSSSSGSSGDIGPANVTFSEPILVPEPSVIFFSAFAWLGLFIRNRRIV